VDEQPRGSSSSDTRGPEDIDPLFGDDDIPVDYDSGYDSLIKEEAPSPILSMSNARGTLSNERDFQGAKAHPPAQCWRNPLEREGVLWSKSSSSGAMLE
jgi:hypothetical protein